MEREEGRGEVEEGKVEKEKEGKGRGRMRGVRRGGLLRYVGVTKYREGDGD